MSPPLTLVTVTITSTGLPLLMIVQPAVALTMGWRSDAHVVDSVPCEGAHGRLLMRMGGQARGEAAGALEVAISPVSISMAKRRRSWRS